MALKILLDLVNAIQSTPFFTVMIDETTDISNKEQVVITLQSVGDDLTVHEHFIGFYFVADIKATTLMEVVKDTLCRLNLSKTKIQGQCYDGASGHRQS